MTLLSRDDLLSFFDGLGMPVSLDDETYCCPTRASFNELLAAAKRDLDRLGIQYTLEGFDCEDFAESAVSLCRIAHARTPGAPQAGLAVGTLSYVKADTGNGHAVVCAVVIEDGKPTLAIGEPQTGLPITLSDVELASTRQVWL